MFRSSRLLNRIQRMIVRVNAIDHDNCFGVQHITPKEVPAYHEPLILRLREEKKSMRFQHDYVMTCSNRQTINYDCTNTIYNQNNLMLPVAMSVASALDAHFDPLMLSDISSLHKPGYTVSQMKTLLSAFNKNYMIETLSLSELHGMISDHYPDYCFSTDKFNIIYAQVHRMALLHPHAEIQFNIYDDLLDYVLSTLLIHFDKYPSFIPSNVRISFHHYDISGPLGSGSKLNFPTTIGSIQGRGETDHDYYGTVSRMEKIALDVSGKQRTYKLTDYVTPERLLLTEPETQSSAKLKC